MAGSGAASNPKRIGPVLCPGDDAFSGGTSGNDINAIMNLSMANLLLTVLFLPLAGALLAGGDRVACRRWALLIAMATFGMTAVLVAAYPGGTEPFAATDWAWL